MNVTIGAGAKQLTLSLSKSATVAELKKDYAAQTKKDIHRLSFKSGDGATRLDDDKKALSEYGIKSGDNLIFKDLGAQISYRGVFIAEYGGPILIVLLYYLRPAFVFGADAVNAPWNWVAELGVLCWMLHFAKREFETFFVHKFSRPTMPLKNLFINCSYYWLFAAFIGHPLCSPKFKSPDETYVYAGLAIFIVSEIGNLICHLMLSNMRPAEGSKKRDIPRGFLFDLVSCPNYTFEVMSWIGFSIMTMLHFSWLFTFIGFIQMADWAMKKHKGYLKDYDEYKKLRRKAIIPFVY
jgi:very-long-chain enoyl-CoA reductase